ncbi:MAG: hypothetical protein JSV22_05145, partial [Bacteroidales bacterium]
MKQSNRLFIKSTTATLLLVFGLIISCNREKTSICKGLEEYLNTISIVNTHEHQINPSEAEMDTHNFYFILHFSSYLKSDLVSAGAPELSLDIIKNHNLEELWDMYGQYLKFSCNTTFYRQFIYGLQDLYDFDDFYFSKDNIKYLSAEIAKNYNNYNSWFDTAFKKTGYSIMFLDQFWNQFNTNIDDKYFALVFNINDLVYGISGRPTKASKNIQGVNRVYELSEKADFNIETLDDYLTF